MRKQLIVILSLSVGICVQHMTAQKKEFTEVIQKEVEVGNASESNLVVKNVFGSIEIVGYSGRTVQVEVERSILAETKSDLELGKSELQLKITKLPNKIIVRPDAPYIDFDEEKLRYRWCDNSYDLSYEHKLDIKVKVPNTMIIDVGTVNDGEVLVENTRGKYLKAENINGGITLTNVTGKTKVNCINGPVTISYANNPTEASEYYSLNGDINISYQKSLSANISFKSMNGDIFTDFDINKQFTRTNKSIGEGSKPKFKFESRPVVQIGKGSVDFDFETLNGNVYIKKI
ncbi:DUF4097 family beta strand repeat-containing protein [Flagellimonas meridianipacifica]|uniref:DUF4097 domain-containing protein n=1 Tax=Flagellimonas meridianipacifica TaxID=1080225 RepID=A0A2T0MJC7_9FLAO|nr:DUF4097 family beta strand repeat-containing protein [Allomuricauda pacifica]PRX57663.1 hypothetical protein CLV81_1672 [Allomuricauda pacifica]